MGIIPGDEGPKAEEHGLFKMSQLHSTDQLNQVIDDNEAQDIAEDSDENEDEETKLPKHTKYDREKGSLDSEGLWYDEHDKSVQDKSESEDDESDNEEELGLEWEDEDTDEEKEAEIEKQNELTKNPLIMSLSSDDQEARKAKRAEMWFSKIGDLDEDSDLEEAELERAVSIVEKKGGRIKKRAPTAGAEKSEGYHSNSESEDDAGQEKEDKEDKEDSE